MPPEITALVEIAIVLTVAVLLPLLTYLWGYNRGAYKVEQGYCYTDLNKIEKRLVRHLQREIKWLRSLLRVVTPEELRQQPDTAAIDAAKEPLSLDAATDLLLGCTTVRADLLANLNGWHLYLMSAAEDAEYEQYESPWVAVLAHDNQVTRILAVG